jgi:hypothetical protein
MVYMSIRRVDIRRFLDHHDASELRCTGLLDVIVCVDTALDALQNSIRTRVSELKVLLTSRKVQKTERLFGGFIINLYGFGRRPRGIVSKSTGSTSDNLLGS